MSQKELKKSQMKLRKNKNEDIVNHPEEWEKLFKILHGRYEITSEEER